MGFNSVYRALQDVFPQIDSRLLRAVAIEHSKDADLAVEVVLVEIIPHLSAHSQSQSSTSSFSNNIENSPSVYEVVVDGGESIQLEATMVFEQSPQAGPSTSNVNPASVCERGLNDKRGEGLFGKIATCLIENDPAVAGHVKKQPTSQLVSISEPSLPVTQEQDPDNSSKTTSENNAASVHERGLDDNRGEGLFRKIVACLVENDPSLKKQASSQLVSTPDSSLPVTQEQDPDTSSKTDSENNAASVHKKGLNDNRGEGLFGKIAAALIENDPAVAGFVQKQASSQSVSIPEPHSPVTQEQDPGSSSKTTSENNSASVYDRVLNDNRNKGLFRKIAACLVEKDSASTVNIQEQASSQSVSIPDQQLPVTQEQDLNSSFTTTSESENNAVVIEENTEDSVTEENTSMVARSDQICNIKLLEDIIEEARNEKKTLVSTMDSVVELMRDVEDKEKAAEEAKMEASRDCSHIFAKVDELKQALGRATEANDMHAGEVYAEKAILATELKELQLRLFTLSDEKNKSLGILNEMREALEIRLATALKEIEALEEQKVEKEKSAREALAYQESRLEKVVEESKKLKREAEENSKLQEFLMDRGRAVDILQGEISVKCQDVRVLKEKFDKRNSQSLTSSQTSSILAASSPASSFRSSSTVAQFPTEPEPDMFETPKKMLELDDSYGVVHDKTPWSSGPQSPVSRAQEKPPTDAWKLLLNDDDWELFDKGELSTGA